MKHLFGFFALSIMLVGCVTTSFLPTDESATYAPTESIKVYWEIPQESYTTIGRVSVESEDIDEESLFVKLKKEAMKVGAHAIIMGDASQQSSVSGIPAYGGGSIISSSTLHRLDALAIRFAD